MKTPTLHDVLWAAQDGRCWICTAQMHKPGNHERAASLDHVWPRKHYGRIGDIGLTLLAHKNCNSLRGHALPTDDDIRVLISVYRRVPSWWLEMASRDAARQADLARAASLRRDICNLMAGSPA